VAIARAVYATLAAPQQAARASSCGDRFLSPTRCSSDRHSLLGRVQSWVSIIRCWRRPSDRWRSFLASKSSQLDAQCASVGCMLECAAAARLHGERSHAEGPTSHEAMQLFRPALAREGVQPLIRMMVLQSSSLQNTVCASSAHPSTSSNYHTYFCRFRETIGSTPHFRRRVHFPAIFQLETCRKVHPTTRIPRFHPRASALDPVNARRPGNEPARACARAGTVAKQLFRYQRASDGCSFEVESSTDQA
jgi:hypothetical protein